MKMSRCKACNCDLRYSTTLIFDGEDYVEYEEDMCSQCISHGFSVYCYTTDHEYNHDWYTEGLTSPKKTD